MPKNKGAGGKNRRKGKGSTNEQSSIVYKGSDQEYGQIIKSLGNSYMEVLCFSETGNTKRRAHIRGKMRKRIWMNTGDIVLVNIRNYQQDVCDLIVKYTPDEARLLRSKGYLPDSIDINKNNDPVENESFVFQNNGEPSSEEKDDIVAEQKRNLDLPASESESEVDEIDLNNL